jgi:hypothetical protein
MRLVNKNCFQLKTNVIKIKATTTDKEKANSRG